ncbi:MAG: glycosyltransferase family 4 protein [Gemmataceae bacterium]
MRISYITAGAAGMYCGSCMHDNTLAAALVAKGHDALLIPTYTPIRTDEDDVSQSRVFFGGINVYLQQKSRLFQKTPWFLDRLLDFPRLLRWVSRFAVKTRADQLGDLTISMLEGTHGNQKKEIQKLVAFLKDEAKPQIVQFSNVLLSGMVPAIKQALGVPIVALLQGDDIFLDMLSAKDRTRSLELIRENCKAIDGFISTSRDYADYMANYLGIDRRKIDVVYPGLKLQGYSVPISRPERPFTIGYFARIAPEKGFHVLVDAYRRFRADASAPPSRLRVSGWLGENQKVYFKDNMAKLKEAGVAGEIDHVDSPDHASKVRFLQSVDVLSVPAVFREPKGLYVLEAWANGVPTVQPRHGSFPELTEASGGGLIVDAENPDALARGWLELARDRERALAMGRRGRDAVEVTFNAPAMAEATLAIYRRFVS